MVKIEGKGGISATIIKHSISAVSDVELLTYELVYPRFIHSELMTHRMLSKNAASSRAVPVKTANELISENPAMPIHWGKNQPGMKSKEEISDVNGAKALWKEAAKSAISFSTIMADSNAMNGHKQWTNRLTEPFSFMKTIVTGTEWNNFFYLRNHPDAQPEFQELARVMEEARRSSTPQILKPGQWHLPYVVFDGSKYWTDPESELDLETAKKISASCCAQVSYRKTDDSIEKAQKIFEMLNLENSDQPAHASPVEHQATPMREEDGIFNIPTIPETWQDGITAMRKDGSLWSGNYRGWIQYRQMFKQVE